MSAIRIDPAKLKVIRKLVAKGMTAREIGKEVGHHATSICYVVRQHKLGPWLSRRGYKPRTDNSPPADFDALYPTMSNGALALHYKRARKTIAAWVKERGLSRPARVKQEKPAKPAARPKPTLVAKHAWVKNGGHKQQPIGVQRDMSPVGLAVEYLRTLSAVYRCDANGRPDPKCGKFWLRGHTVLTDADVIERADWLRSRELRAA
jgi:hypothetical protein